MRWRSIDKQSIIFNKIIINDTIIAPIIWLGYNNFWIEQRGSEDDEVLEDGN
jgi:hypothetical protein